MRFKSHPARDSHLLGEKMNKKINKVSESGNIHKSVVRMVIKGEIKTVESWMFNEVKI